jgi:hypothetical protein
MWNDPGSRPFFYGGHLHHEVVALLLLLSRGGEGRALRRRITLVFVGCAGVPGRAGFLRSRVRGGRASVSRTGVARPPDRADLRPSPRGFARRAWVRLVSRCRRQRTQHGPQVAGELASPMGFELWTHRGTEVDGPACGAVPDGIVTSPAQRQGRAAAWHRSGAVYSGNAVIRADTPSTLAIQATPAEGRSKTEVTTCGGRLARFS